MANLIYDSFKICELNHLNSEDTNNLTKLYLPIMGIDAFSVYSVLSSFEINQEYTFKNLLDMLAKFTLKTLNCALEKLEAFGLLKTFYKESEGYIFEVLSPMSKVAFLENELLRELLIGAIGEDEVKKLTNKQDYKGFKEITKKFEEVFSISTTSIDKTITNIVKNNVKIKNEDFNYSLFKSLCENIIPDEVLSDSSFEGHILNISFTYKLNPMEMHECILKTMEIDQNLEYSSIALNARKMFNVKFSASSPHIASIKDDEYLESIQDDEYYAVLSSIEDMAFTDMLYSITKMKPASSEIKMLEKLQDMTGFSTAILNIVVLYVNKLKDGVLPGYAYFEKICANLKRAKVKNAYDALKFFTTEKEETQKKGTKKKEVEVPSWYKEYKEQLDADKQVVFSDSEKEESIKFIKELFGDE